MASHAIWDEAGLYPTFGDLSPAVFEAKPTKKQLICLREIT
ncbi:hypothetical protein BSU04_38375 [Caballeronia sordidicola]|uniref:Uncharacterized protein n=1 Tax=Caballeronia sordidicola TaxID=196367 RepID=A0A226WPV6_CABSO|nr:hypothetical protein BSU04_38375 [Caballeronia sordidicola]